MRNVRLLATALGLVLRLLAPTSGLSQGVEAEPGDIVTAPVPVPEDMLERTGSSVSFAIEVPAGVALVSPRAGTFTWEDGDPLFLPVTVRVPESVRAGPLQGLNVTFAAADLESRTVPVLVIVRSAHQLSVDLAPVDDVVERGNTATFRYVVSNLGNSADSVGLHVMAGGPGTASGLPAWVWLEPFEVREGQFSVAVPENAVIGKTEYVRLTAAGSHSQGADHATYAVAAERGLFPDLVQVPTTIFLGSTATCDTSWFGCKQRRLYCYHGLRLTRSA